MLTPLEKSVLDKLLDKPSELFDTLRQQLSRATVSRREFSGVGFFTEFALPADAQVARAHAAVQGPLLLTPPGGVQANKSRLR